MSSKASLSFNFSHKIYADCIVALDVIIINIIGAAVQAVQLPATQCSDSLRVERLSALSVPVTVHSTELTEAVRLS